MTEDPERPEPDDVDLDEIQIDVPKGDDSNPMTLRELQEALKDETHPRHDEAVVHNKELAEQLAPMMDQLRNTVLGQQSAIAKSIAGINKTWMQQLTKDMSPVIKGLDLGKSSRVAPATLRGPKIEPIRSPLVDLQRQQSESMKAIEEALAEFDQERQEDAQATTERLAREEALATKNLEVLTSMDANLRVLADRIDHVDTRIKEGNLSSDKSSKHMLIVGWATLIATCLTLAATVVIYLLSR